MKTADLPILAFANQKKWADWLARQHDKSRGVWMQIAKKGAGIPTVTYEQALDVAICYGWIDSQKKGFNEQCFLQKFSPRGPRSIWSRINVEKAERLIASGEMKPTGWRAIEAAQASGRWDRAYAGQRTMEIPADFQAGLDKSPKAKAFYDMLNSANRYAVLFRIQRAQKAGTRVKSIKRLVEMLERGETYH